MKKIIILSLLIINACSFSNSPEGVLRDFINYRFKSNQSKDGLLEYLTGPMHENYQQMTEEDVTKFTDLSGHKKKKLKINFKNCTKTECSITYTLGYKVMENSKETAVEVRRAAKIVQGESGIWKISEITSEGSKTHFEGKNAITPDDFKEQYNTDPDNIKLDSSGNVIYDSSGKAQTK